VFKKSFPQKKNLLRFKIHKKYHLLSGKKKSPLETPLPIEIFQKEISMC